MRYLSSIMGDLVIIVAIGAPCTVIAIVWDKMPWFVRYVPRRKMRAEAKDEIKAFEERESCPEAFDPTNKLYVPCDVPNPMRPQDVDAIAAAVFEKIKPKT